MPKEALSRLACQMLALGLALLPLPSLARPDLLLCDSHGLVRGAEIAMEKGCFGCHTLSNKRIGPPYREIAARYERQPTSVATLASKIRTGGSGAWGSAVMPANPVTQEEAEILARWIQSL